MMQGTRIVRTATALAVAALFSGCATWGNMDRSEKGTAVGATGGALVGAAVGGPVGAAIGAGVGGYAGHHQAGGTTPDADVRAARAAARADDSGAPRDGAAMNAAHAHDASTVRSLQAALRERGFDPGPVDGVWGPQTEDALRDFQQSLGLAASGQPDAQTMSALDVRAPLASGGMRDVDGTASSPAVR